MKRYLSGLTANYLNIFISTVVSLVLIPWLLKKTGPEVTGTYLLLMTASNFVAVGIGWLAGAGVKLIATADAAEGEDRSREVHWVVFVGFAVYATVVLLAASVFSFGAGSWWLSHASAGQAEQARNACILLGVYVWISYVHNADLSLLTARLRQGEANLYRSLSQILFAFLAFASLAYRPRIDLLMAAQAVAVLIVAVYARIRLRIGGLLGPFRLHWPDRALAREMFLSVGQAYFIFGLAQFVVMYADVFVVGAILGPSAVTAYVLVWKVADFISMLLGRVSETLSPYFTRMEARGETVSLRELFLTTERLQHWLAISAGVAYMVIGPTLVGLWVGAANRPSQWWLYVLAGAALFFVVVNRHDVILHFGLARVERVILPQVLEVLLKLALTFALFPKLGIGAPLAAMVIVQVCGITWWYRRSGLRLAGATWAEWRRQVLGPTLILAAMLLICVIVVGPQAMAWPVRQTLLLALGCGAATVVLAYWSDRRQLVPLSRLPLMLSNR